MKALVKADINQVPGILDELRGYRQWADPKLRETFSSVLQPHERLNVSLGLLHSDPSQLEYLEVRLLDAKPDQVETICSILADHKADVAANLWRVAKMSEKGEGTQLLQAASALALLDLDNDTAWSAVADRVVDAVAAENSLRAGIWVKILQPAHRYLIPRLRVVYRNKNGDRSQLAVELALGALELYAADDLDTLVELLLEGTPGQFAVLFDEFSAHGEEGLSTSIGQRQIDRRQRHSRLRMASAADLLFRSNLVRSPPSECCHRLASARPYDAY